MNREKVWSPAQDSSVKDIVCTLHNLDPSELEEFSIFQENFEQTVRLVALVKLKDRRECCPRCGCSDPKIHSYTKKDFNHSIIEGYNTIIRLKHRRYVCPDCGRTYYEHNPFAAKNRRISLELMINVLEELAEPTETFTSVARRHKIAISTAASLFDSCVSMARLPLPEYICIDENYCIRHQRSKYACILVDFLTNEAIDVLPNRFKEDMIRYFMEIPWEERKQVKGVCIDMYRTYRDVVRECFPSSTKVVVDHFHVIKELNTQIDKVRIKTMNSISHSRGAKEKEIRKMKNQSDFSSQSVQAVYKPLEKEKTELTQKYNVLKKFNWILFKPFSYSGFDPERKKIWNHIYQEYLNYNDIREKILEINPDLTECLKFREELDRIYEREPGAEAIAALDRLIVKMSRSKIQEMSHFGNTLKNWKTEIINSLEVIDITVRETHSGDVQIRDRRLNNGVIERINKIVKNIKNNSNGYSNFHRMRNRILYVLRKSRSYNLNGTYTCLKNKKVKKEE